MSAFYTRDGQFWLDDKPQLIQAGEFHYFRTPRDQWPHRLGLLRDAGFNTMATYIPWLWHQPAEGVTDLDGHSHLMRDLAGYLDLATDMGFLIIPRPGPYIMAETINEGVPPWVFNNYPQVAIINQEEQPQNIAGYLQPDFLACVEQWYEAVFAVLSPRQVTRGGRIIMVQLDNEMGMPHWVRNMFDLNPDTMARFAAYLQRHYGRALSARFPTNDLPAFLRNGLLHPAVPYAAHIVTDYRRFYRNYLEEYAAFLWQVARKNGLEVPPIVNVHGFSEGAGGRSFPLGLSQLIKVIEMPGMVTATDVYPLHIDEGNFHQLLFLNEATVAVQNRDQALFSAEFQSGGNQDFGGQQSSLYDLHSRLSISVGMRAINHYLFTGGENDPILSPVRRHDWGPPVRTDGTTRNHYRRYQLLSRVLDTYGEALTLSQPQTVTTIGFLLDDFMTEINNMFTAEATRIITHQRERILHDQIARGLALTHRPFRVVELTRANLDAANMPSLWVMVDKVCPAAVQEKLLAYAQQGGQLILIGRICEEGEDGVPATLLKEALGIEEVDSDPPFTWSAIDVFQYADVPASFVQSYTGRFDHVFARRANGAVVGFVNRLGKGRVMLLGAALPADSGETLADLDVFHQMALWMDCQPLFQLSEWADVRLSQGPTGSFLFINNYQDDPIAPVISYEGRPLFDGNPVHLPARRGLILPLEWQLDNDVVLHFATGELTQATTDAGRITLDLVPDDCVAELSCAGYVCEQGDIIHQYDEARARIKSRDGRIVLRKRG